MPPITRPCQTRNPEWWETGNDGNRLALMLCRICTGCPDNDPRPTGVIRSEVAYGDDSKPRGQCACGYPAEAPIPDPAKNPRIRAGHTIVQPCRRCQLPGIERYREAIIRWRDRGDSYTTIAKRIAFSPDHVSMKYREWTADREAVAA